MTTAAPALASLTELQQDILLSVNANRQQQYSRFWGGTGNSRGIGTRDIGAVAQRLVGRVYSHNAIHYNCEQLVEKGLMKAVVPVKNTRPVVHTYKLTAAGIKAVAAIK